MKCKGNRSPAQGAGSSDRAPSSGNNFIVLREQEQSEKAPGEEPKEAPPNETKMQEKTSPGTQEHQSDQSGLERKEGQGKATTEQEENPDAESGEVSTDSDSTDASGSIVTPKKAGRGRKSKKEEREKETYKDVLSGSQPTIKQLINVRMTRKHAKAHKGANTPPQVNHETNLLEL
jgi:hypothetical protein